MKVLIQQNDDLRQIKIVERQQDGSILYYDGPILYTHVSASGDNMLEYVAAMERALEGATKILVLGTAGGALATQLSRRGATVTAVDNWPYAFEIARRWFHLPPHVECVHSDALTYLRESGRKWDAIAVDVFHGTEIPDSMFTSDIGALLASNLTPGGLIVWNVADSPRSWPARWIAKALQLADFTPSLISVIEGDVGNTLVVCDTEPRRRRGTNPPRERRFVVVKSGA
jgi:spermidine synthase